MKNDRSDAFVAPLDLVSCTQFVFSVVDTAYVTAYEYHSANAGSALPSLHER